MKSHPIAEIFPMLAEAELAELASDIKQNGLKLPIYLYEGKILDGRNRFKACGVAGVDPKFEDYSGDSPTSFVISLNLKRRHLTTSQSAAAAVEALPWFEKEAKKRQENRDLDKKLPKSEKGKSVEKAADLLHTNRQYVSDAKAIKKSSPEKFESIRTGEKTIREVKREIKREEQDRKIKAAQAVPKSNTVSGPFDLILADPPWRYEHCEADNREIENQYPTAALGDIYMHFSAANPEPKKDCILLLWATAPKLEEALMVMNAWGFSYRSCAVWDKEKIGMGYWWRIQHELLLVGVRGAPGATPECERVSSMFKEARTSHSRKPESVYSWIDRAFPSAVKLEMYQRSPRLGWAGWGNEA